MAVDPLQGFDFTRAWLQVDPLVRSYLPDHDELLLKRVSHLSEPHGWDPWTSGEVDELRRFNMECGNYRGAQLCDVLSQPDCLVVVTGQQPNLLVSPLFILYKALSAVRWAHRLTEQLGRAVTPVFWVASDDEDFAELKQASMVAHDGEVRDVGRTISRGQKTGTMTPASAWDLSGSLPRLVAELEKALDGWPAGTEILNLLTEELDAESNFESSFCRLLSKLLGDEFPMIFVAPRLKVMRRRGADILIRDVVAHASINTKVTDAAAKLTGAGYPVKLAREPEALNCFLLREGRRCRLMRVEDTVVAVDPQSHKLMAEYDDESLQAHIRNAPDDFAPNVITRPVVQDTALPTALYVGGPGELAYLAVLREAYKELGCVRSAVVPRAFISLNFPEEAASGSPKEILQQGSDDGRRLINRVDEMQVTLSQNLADIRALAEEVGPAAVKAVDKTEVHILRGISQMKTRLARQVAPEQWNLVARRKSLAAPEGKAQERVLAPWQFILPGEVDKLARHLFSSVDFSNPGPHVVALPPWLEGSV